MVLLEHSLQVVGIAMCVLALLPLAFWSAQSWATLRHNRLQFRESQELLRQQILAANNLRTPIRSGGQTSESDAVAKSSSDLMRQAPVAAIALPPSTTTRLNEKSKTNPKPQADGRWLGFRKFRVEKLVKETASCTSVYLAPLDGQPIASFKAGQHLPLRFQIPGQPKPVIRCYSLSAGSGHAQYRISVKAIPAADSNHGPGLVSTFINSKLKEGDVIESKAPSGSFCLDAKDSRPVVLLAGGIGITPMLSMLESIRAHSPNRPTILFYGVSNKTEHAFADDLRQFTRASPNTHVVNCYSNPQPEDVQGVDFHVKGYVSLELIKRVVSKPNCQFYLCGPPAFMKSLSEGLEAWGVPADQVHSEAFGPASINKAQSTVTSSAVAGTVEVAFEQSEQTVTWNPECESLLELAESSGIKIDSGCRAGSCGTCSTALLAGEVQYPEGTPVDCEPGQCLTCVARPISSIKLGA